MVELITDNALVDFCGRIFQIRAKEPYETRMTLFRTKKKLHRRNWGLVMQAVGGGSGKTSPKPKRPTFVPANHLANFKPPERTSVPFQPRRRQTQTKGNKGTYINSQFRFLLNGNRDHSERVFESDKFVDWSEVEQVIFLHKQLDPTDISYLCPICREPPTFVPRITSCGHIFCFACILKHHINRLDSPDIRCPACNEPLDVDDSKSVKIKPVQDFEAILNEARQGRDRDRVAQPEGQQSPRITNPRIELTLIRRDPRSTVTFPASDNQAGLPRFPSLSPLQSWDDVRFSKYVTVSPDYVINHVLKPDAHAVMAKLSLVKRGRQHHQLDVMALELAESILWKSERPRLEREKTMGSISAPPVYLENQQVNVKQAFDFVDDIDDPSFLDDEDVVQAPQAKPRKVAERQPKPSTHGTQGHNPVHFYQASDGQHLYLKKLDLQILEHGFRSRAKSSQRAHSYQQKRDVELPATIGAKLLKIVNVIVDEHFRAKGFPELSHLPLGAQIQLCEIDLKEHVPEETFKVFEPQLKKDGRWRVGTSPRFQPSRQGRGSASGRGRGRGRGQTGPKTEVPNLNPTQPDHEVMERLVIEELEAGPLSSSSSMEPDLSAVAGPSNAPPVSSSVVIAPSAQGSSVSSSSSMEAVQTKPQVEDFPPLQPIHKAGVSIRDETKRSKRGKMPLLFSNTSARRR
ncbi:hypothetical protein HK102_000960 [Quaeritorhiza haematococci]|nr:hypothetical protein HK102_000960 [Quaeritorhiza haematococci]